MVEENKACCEEVTTGVTVSSDNAGATIKEPFDYDDCEGQDTGVTVSSIDTDVTKKITRNPFANPWVLNNCSWGSGIAPLTWGRGSGLENKPHRSKVKKRKARIAKASRKANRRKK